MKAILIFIFSLSTSAVLAQEMGGGDAGTIIEGKEAKKAFKVLTSVLESSDVFSEGAELSLNSFNKDIYVIDMRISCYKETFPTQLANGQSLKPSKYYNCDLTNTRFPKIPLYIGYDLANLNILSDEFAGKEADRLVADLEGVVGYVDVTAIYENQSATESIGSRLGLTLSIRCFKTVTWLGRSYECEYDRHSASEKSYLDWSK